MALNTIEKIVSSEDCRRSPMNLEKVVNEEKKEDGVAKNTRKKDRSHIVVVPGSDPEMYKCTICRKVFRSKKGKCYHDSCVTGVKPWQCESCDQSFVKRTHFEYHVRVHMNYRPYKCSLCDKAFPQRNKLNRHMISHKHEKEFVCEKCGKRYSKKEDLNNHATLHTGNRPHVCKLCGKTFAMITNLNRHVRTHSNERPYTCELCRKSFKNSSLLIRHKKTHGKERPFSCDHCNRPFLSKSELSRHLVIHTDVKPFSCTHCVTIFRRKDNLVRHIRHHHAENEKETPSDVPTNDPPISSKFQASNNNSSTKSKKSVKSNAKTMKSPLKYPSLLSRGNSRDQIKSRMDALGNITPIIRGPGEYSNAVPVINGPIVSSVNNYLSADDENGPARTKKTYTHTEPIPLAEAAVINRRIEEKLYAQSSSLSTSYNYFFRHMSSDIGSTAHATNIVVPAVTKNLAVDTISKDRQVPVASPPRSSKCDNSCESERLDSDGTKTSGNYVSAIRTSESFHENANTQHWRRRTAESFKSSRKIPD